MGVGGVMLTFMLTPKIHAHYGYVAGVPWLGMGMDGGMPPFMLTPTIQARYIADIPWMDGVMSTFMPT